jgi:hypothetical protein
MSSDRDPLRQALYERVCESYHAVDDFRMKLLGLLPVATGTGVFLLLNGKAELLGQGGGDVSDALFAIGAFGFAFTLGLFMYELFGIKKCHYLIVAGKQLEVEMGLLGQFRSRPRELAGFINEPFASAIIYPASMAAWAFLAFSLRSGLWAAVAAGAVFIVGFTRPRGVHKLSRVQNRVRFAGRSNKCPRPSHLGRSGVSSVRCLVGTRAGRPCPEGAESVGLRPDSPGQSAGKRRPKQRQPG